MKKLTCLCIALLLLGVLAGCGTEPTDGADVLSSAPAAVIVTNAATTTTTTEVPTTTTTAAPTWEVDANGVTHQNIHLMGKKDAQFELPLEGATGFASYPIDLWEQSDRQTVLQGLTPGDAFTVLAEQDALWQIRTTDGVVGWVDYTTCYLNIVDVIPSIVIRNTNGTASAFLSSGQTIPDITGKQLYQTLYHNPRYGEERHIVAANYQTVKKIHAAQQAALAEGYALCLNEAYRPLDVQVSICDALNRLQKENETVRSGISQSPWGIGWFIASGISTHQMGCAIDTSLVRVNEITWNRCGGYVYPTVTAYTDGSMPTPIHELSVAAASLSKPVNSGSKTAWKSIPAAAGMTEDALRLRRYCTAAELYPLASEWWHFNDLDTKAAVLNLHVTTPYHLSACVSEIPQ